MKPSTLRTVALFWPLLASPLAAVLIVKVSGPLFDGAVNQASIVTRSIGLAVWILLMLVAAIVTGFVLRHRTKREIVLLAGASLAGIAATCLIAFGAH